MRKVWVSLVGGLAVVATVLSPIAASAQQQPRRHHNNNNAALGLAVGIGLLAGAAAASQNRRERVYRDRVYDEPGYEREYYPVRRTYREPAYERDYYPVRRTYRAPAYDRDYYPVRRTYRAPRYSGQRLYRRAEVCQRVSVRRRDGIHVVRQCE